MLTQIYINEQLSFKEGIAAHTHSLSKVAVSFRQIGVTGTHTKLKKQVPGGNMRFIPTKTYPVLQGTKVNHKFACQIGM